MNNQVKYPRCLVGCPTFNGKEYCLDKFIKSIKNLTYPNYDILIVDTTNPAHGGEFKKKITDHGIEVISHYNTPQFVNVYEGRNIIRKRVLEGGYDYYMSIESDHVVPVDIIERLLANKKKVVGGWYMSRNRNNKSILNLVPPWLDRKEPDFYDKEEVIKVFSMGLGDVLIHRSVLEKVKFRWEEYTFEGTDIKAGWWDDIWFYIDCDKQGIDVWCDKRIYVEHIIDEGVTL